MRCSWPSSAPPIAIPPPLSSRCASTRDTQARRRLRLPASSFLRLNKDLQAKQPIPCRLCHTLMEDQGPRLLRRSPTARLRHTHTLTSDMSHHLHSGLDLLGLWNTRNVLVQQVLKIIPRPYDLAAHWPNVEAHLGQSLCPSHQDLRHRIRKTYSSAPLKEMAL
jgi:hypothetical protein